MVDEGLKISGTEQEGSSVIKHFSGELNVVRVPVEKYSLTHTSHVRILNRKLWRI